MKYILVILIVPIFAASLYAQQGHATFYVSGGEITFKIPDNSSLREYDSLVNYYGMINIPYDSIDIYINENLEWNGWRVKNGSDGYIIIHKSLEKLEGSMDREKEIYVNSEETRLTGSFFGELPATFGTNRLRGNSVTQDSDAKTVTFHLPGYNNANEVILSGNFNGWSTNATRMTPRENGWFVSLDLKPGKYHYKFIVDGNWMIDPNNRLKENNQAGDYNSVYFVTNHEFRLSGFGNARRVRLAGSFNNWRERQLNMIKTDHGWKLPVYLAEGTYTYKYIVDGDWITDPGNDKKLPDGGGNTNSLLTMGESVLFELNGFADAEKVVLAGEFNAWNENELIMTKTDNGWKYSLALGAGSYQYKFIVDGVWTLDPNNAITMGAGDYVNSVRIIKPNYTFKLSGFADAEDVRIAGSFNNWDRFGPTLTRKNGVWQIDLYVRPGKLTYKFVVDGEFILDPDNPLWEQNRFNTGNSVLWIEPEFNNAP